MLLYGKPVKLKVKFKITTLMVLEDVLLVLRVVNTVVEVIDVPVETVWLDGEVKKELVNLVSKKDVKLVPTLLNSVPNVSLVINQFYNNNI